MIFYCHYANGDLFEAKALMDGWRKAHSGLESRWAVAHKHSAKLFYDQPWLDSIELEPWMDPSKPWVLSPEGELAVNLWVGWNRRYVGPGNAVLMEAMFQMHNDTRRALGFTDLPGMADDYWPDVAFATCDRQGTPGSLLFCNGPVTSGQASNFDFSPAILETCRQYPELQVYATAPVIGNQPDNLTLTSQLFANEVCDLPEISRFSRGCRVLFGRTSGPHVWVQSRANWTDPTKVFVSFTSQAEAAWNVREGAPRALAKRVWRSATSPAEATTGVLGVLREEVPKWQKLKETLSPGKILLVLPYWKGDFDEAMSLAALVADLEQARGDLADFMFLPRYDAPEVPPGITERVARKFNVITYRSKRRSQGWPAACNDLWFSAMEWAWSMADAGKSRYKAILWLEPDCVPLIRGWIRRAHQEWDAYGVRVLGPEANYGGGRLINGTALYSGNPDFLYWIARQVGGLKSYQAWDSALAKEFFRRGADSCPGFRSVWNLKTAPEGTLETALESGVFFWHGVKDGSLRSAVRKKYKLPEF